MTSGGFLSLRRPVSLPIMGKKALLGRSGGKSGFRAQAGRHHGIINLIVRHTFTPHNNTRLSHLCGPMDAHLRSIEAGLQVSIAHRHEQFKVDGPKAQAQQAMELLQALYEMAERPIAADTVQLMMAGDGEGTAEQQPLQTRRTDLKARTPTQAAYLDNIASHDITFGIGPAGTGKTYLAVASAVDRSEEHTSELQSHHD